VTGAGSWADEARAVVEIERRLLHLHHWTPQQIDRLTAPEIEMALASDLEKPFGGVTLDSPEELQEYLLWRRGLSWAEKLAIAREET
jgi:hypothetical protein